MDTLKDKEVLEDMVEQGNMPWRLGRAAQASATKVNRKVG
jgi:glucose-1-phosphate cytidylyltransferase